ncbi:unannotated protein [freshwater metagenome]|uniref:Unannotated protein n=1 Tax=freshwater metagenome TaxID=449393 RepID=A0A6J6BVK6_9ZZZZ
MVTRTHDSDAIIGTVGVGCRNFNAARNGEVDAVGCLTLSIDGIAGGVALSDQPCLQSFDVFFRDTQNRQVNFFKVQALFPQLRVRGLLGQQILVCSDADPALMSKSDDVNAGGNFGVTDTHDGGLKVRISDQVNQRKRSICIVECKERTDEQGLRLSEQGDSEGKPLAFGAAQARRAGTKPIV